MRLVTIGSRPYTVINGKDFAVYRWFALRGESQPIFIQVGGRTALVREDLPTDDWIVLSGKDRGHRIATAWRRRWFDYKLDAARTLAFLGGSTAGSHYLAFRYLARRFGLPIGEDELAFRSAEFANDPTLGRPSVLSLSNDRALSETALVTLDVPTYWEADDAAELLGTATRA